MMLNQSVPACANVWHHRQHNIIKVFIDQITRISRCLRFNQGLTDPAKKQEITGFKPLEKDQLSIRSASAHPQQGNPPADIRGIN
ncbi:MAG: hypothetical protein ABI642_01145 [Polaromonas sp.]